MGLTSTTSGPSCVLTATLTIVSTAPFSPMARRPSAGVDAGAWAGMCTSTLDVGGALKGARTFVGTSRPFTPEVTPVSSSVPFTLVALAFSTRTTISTQPSPERDVVPERDVRREVQDRRRGGRG